MNVSECIQPDHLRRLAVVYIRQSSPQQIVSNQESLQLQYNLAQRAQTYGWNQGQICVIDADLGCSGRSADNRPGFQELVTLVNEEAAGILFAYDVTRLARNCTDWYQLLDLCGYRHCLVGDQDGIYDPATPNGRLILGLKGLIAELELHTLQQRMNAGLLNKAQRGELAQLLPVGLVREPSGQVVKHPNQEVQSRLALVFATFLQVKSAAKVVGFFHDRDLRIPRRGRDGAVVWRSASPEAIGSILKNPAYAGAFVHGRTRTVAPGRSGHKPWSKRLPVAEWKICLLDKYPAYIDWTTFEKIQTMLRDNHSDYGNPSTRGVPRRGKALLHGILYCGACGHQLVVSYKKRTTYICNYFRQRQEGKLCQYLPAEPIEAHVVQAYLEALVPRRTGPVHAGSRRPPAAGHAGPASAAATTRALAVSSAAGRTPVPPSRSGQSPGGCRVGETLGSGFTRLAGCRSELGTATASARGPGQAAGHAAPGLYPGGNGPVGILAARSPLRGAEESSVTLPDRQSGRAPCYARQDSDPHCLEGR